MRIISPKLKEQIKGGLVSTGAFVILINFLPEVGKIQDAFYSSLPLACLAILIGVFWK